MSAARPAGRSGRLLVATVMTAAGMAVLVGLGLWQLDRKTWKEGLIAALTERLAARPGNLPARETWPQLVQKEAEFRRVAFPAEFLHDREALVYTAGSALRPDVSGPGYWVFTPARLTGGSLVMVNRGFVPEASKDAGARAQGQVAGVVDIVGVLRWPEDRGAFTPADSPERNLWFLRDHAAIAAAKGLGPVAPFYIDQEAPIPPGGLPRAGPLNVNLRNNHLQYSLTWFGLALALAAVFLIWAFHRPGRSGSGV